eukprot:TRINITY_DN9260_c0_g1_i3.p2 TRINITY_DN9260_c0_g1~~TRINITY_DN9260_c0_g1_i3.p2  ORF type:complete len:167 (+),score=18.78 TRINITY_DN9260_c0_g1_i3:77-577(+)
MTLKEAVAFSAWLAVIFAGAVADMNNCSGEPADIEDDTTGELQEVSLLQRAPQRGRREDCNAQGNWLRCYDDQCANVIFQRRRRNGNLGACRRRNGIAPDGASKCCNDQMWYSLNHPEPTVPPAPSCTADGWSRCLTDACASLVVSRRRRYSSMGECRRRSGVGDG